MTHCRYCGRDTEPTKDGSCSYCSGPLPQIDSTLIQEIAEFEKARWIDSLASTEIAKTSMIVDAHCADSSSLKVWFGIFAISGLAIGIWFLGNFLHGVM